ncbi:glutathione S-transferase family protein [Paucibacter sp. APW11]|uniref:Glutathione S-transferase family protein n=1 Tax=Roseateles aquae TaxID=3077235 RepID=A0ABU3PAC4_9BURK|nr:glutathione S-transferase family protein [Paucibacter sp. APW11]MDT8999217.1 glutathione S-transferase family protein [Paucibacter sp. APW11]
MDSSTVFFGNHESGHSYKVALLLALARIPHRYRWIDLELPREARPADFRAASRFGEVPVLVWQGRAYCQSNAILLSLAEQHPQWWGGDAAAAREWLCWEANRIGFSVPNLRFARHWSPQPPAVMAWLEARARADLQTLDEALAGRDFLLGDEPSIADLSCCGYLFWLEQAGLDAADLPHLQAWLARIAGLPAWQAPYDLLKKKEESQA